jgi:hypothetical protein
MALRLRASSVKLNSLTFHSHRHQTSSLTIFSRNFSALSTNSRNDRQYKSAETLGIGFDRSGIGFSRSGIGFSRSGIGSNRSVSSWSNLSPLTLGQDFVSLSSNIFLKLADLPPTVFAQGSFSVSSRLLTMMCLII